MIAITAHSIAQRRAYRLGFLNDSTVHCSLWCGAPFKVELYFSSPFSVSTARKLYKVLGTVSMVSTSIETHRRHRSRSLFSFSNPFSLCRLRNKALCLATPTPYWFDLSARNICHQLYKHLEKDDRNSNEQREKNNIRNAHKKWAHVSLVHSPIQHDVNTVASRAYHISHIPQGLIMSCKSIVPAVHSYACAQLWTWNGDRW